MKFKTPTNSFKEIAIHHYRVDWGAPQGSKFSREVLMFLKPYWKHDVVCAELPLVGTRNMRYDYVNISKHIVVETDGVSHFDPLSHFHQGSSAKWLAQIKRDALKDRCAEINGFQMVRIVPSDLPLTKDFFKRQFSIEL